MSPFPPKWAAVAILSVLCWGLGGGGGRRLQRNRAMFSPLAGRHYSLIGSLVRCLLDESQGNLRSLGRIHAKLETTKMPLSK